MTVTEAVRQRRSIRAFLPTPVSEATLREVLDTARWAPSGSNVQAWKIIAVAGDERDAVVRMALESMGTPSLANHDEFPVYPPNLWEPLRTRRFALAEDMYRALGIPRGTSRRAFAMWRATSSCSMRRWGSSSSSIVASRTDNGPISAC